MIWGNLPFGCGSFSSWGTLWKTDIKRRKTNEKRYRQTYNHSLCLGFLTYSVWIQVFFYHLPNSQGGNCSRCWLLFAHCCSFWLSCDRFILCWCCICLTLRCSLRIYKRSNLIRIMTVFYFISLPTPNTYMLMYSCCLVFSAYGLHVPTLVGLDCTKLETDQHLEQTQIL